MPNYPVLEYYMFKRGVKKKDIAIALGIAPKTLSNKLHGKAPLTWPEACFIQRQFFPDVEKDRLYSKADPESLSSA